ncbi:MAG: thioredoxin-disulfide reductase [Eubacteriales bacterium]|nr:thioredoxin-disulfide reductase [Eubacteriales bacterium]
MIVIGGGPSGYTAALYATRAGLDTLVIEKMSIGGQMAQTSQIDNYPGYDEGIDGIMLGEKMRAGAQRFGAKSKFAEAYSAELQGDIKKVNTSEGIFLAKTVVIATGADHMHLGIEDEDKFIGRGLAYCATCDGMFYKDKTVAIVGGGNSAATDAMVLSRICAKVILIHRRDTLRATKVYHEPLMKAENIEFRWNSVVNNLLGDEKISGIEIRDVNTQEITTIDVEGIFISIGRSPETGLLNGQLELDKGGYIVADESTKTNIEGVFAVGDVRTKVFRQIVTAAADGAVAAYYAEEYLY